MTSGGTRQRKQGPLTKVKARRSNAYGASGRVGAAEELSISATGFAQAFQNQRGDAVARDDEDEQEEEVEDESVDELNNEARMSGAQNGSRRSLAHERSSPPRVPAAFAFSETPDAPFSDDDLAFSIGNTSKSFGMEHEAGMLQETQRRSFLRSSSQQPTPVPRSNLRLVGQSTRVLPSTKATPDKVAIDESIDDLLAEERARLQREGPGRSRLPPRPVSRLAPLPEQPEARPTPRFESQPEHRIEPRSEPVPLPRLEHRSEPRADIRVRPQAQPRAQPNRPEVVKQWLGQVEPAEALTHDELPEDEPEWVWLPLVKQLFWSLLAFAGILLLSLLLATKSSDTDTNPRIGMRTAIGTRIWRSWDDLAGWIMPEERKYNDTADILAWLHGDGTDDDHLIWSRMRKNHVEYQGKFDALSGAVQKLKDDLPEYVVIRRHLDGRSEITDDFWNALLSKAQSKGDDAQWINFLKTNSQKVRDLDGASVDVTEPTARPQIVSRREFMETMEQRYTTMSASVDQKIIEALKSHETQIKSLIQAEARKTLMDSIRLQSLAQSNLVANYELNLKKPNYFSTGLGAVIEPARTSSTFDDSPTWLASKVKSSTRGATANPPRAALTKWEEFGDCWCAAPNPIKGYARLGISLPRPVYPKQVTVEHAPMSMSPTGNVNNAPRNIELWAETDQPIKHHYGQHRNTCLDPADLRGRGYVCLGTFKYNIHASNHVQTFDLDAELSIPTSRVVVQVTSNWGAANTCIYRLRLHGDDAEERYNYDVTLND
jgi:SUN domain-containing protein 1/2